MMRGNLDADFPTMSPCGSMGDLLDPLDEELLKPSNDDVDALLSKLEQQNSILSVNGNSFLRTILDDDDLDAVNMVSISRETIFDHSNDSFTGMNIEPISLKDLPDHGDATMMFIDDLKESSVKLDEFLGRSFNKFELTESQEEEIYSGEIMTTGFQPEPALSGKRRRAPRRGSLPIMHLNYSSTLSQLPEDDPYAPTPFDDSPRVSTSRVTSEDEVDEDDDDDDDDEKSTTSNIFGQPIEVPPIDPPEKRRRAQRRGSLPTMHINYTSTPTILEQNSMNMGFPIMEHMNLNSPQGEESFGEVKVEVRTRMQRRLSTNSYFQPQTLSSSPESPRVPSSLDPTEMMLRLQALMKQSASTQKALQTWDKKNGLPRSHSQTMVNSSRSRKQLQDGVILPKWDGTPLINGETELGKPKARTSASKKKDEEEEMEGGQGNKFGGKMQRRMSAPACSLAY